MLQLSSCQMTEPAPKAAPIRPQSRVCRATAASSPPISAANSGTTGEYVPYPATAEPAMVISWPRATPRGKPRIPLSSACFFMEITSHPKNFANLSHITAGDPGGRPVLQVHADSPREV